MLCVCKDEARACPVQRKRSSFFWLACKTG